MTLLSRDHIDRYLSTSQWRARNDKAEIAREWKFADFAAALAFVNQVGELADQLGHHPDILLHGYNRVLLTLSTHSEGGLTAKDLELAGKLDLLPKVGP